METILQRQNSILVFSIMFKVEYSVRYERLKLSVLAVFVLARAQNLRNSEPCSSPLLQYIKKGHRTDENKIKIKIIKNKRRIF